MPHVVDYPQVLSALLGRGLRSLYHNSGAFGFGPDAHVLHRGWVGEPDATIKPAALALTRPVPPPYPDVLADRLAEVIDGPAWVLPKSHWAYELEFGNRIWLPDAFAAVGIDAAPLAGRNTGDAIAFGAGDGPALRGFVRSLLTNLAGSDFQLVPVDRPAVCTIHHHGQLWWSTTDAELLARLDAAVPVAEVET